MMVATHVIHNESRPFPRCCVFKWEMRRTEPAREVDNESPCPSQFVTLALIIAALCWRLGKYGS
jgi:hypothetical protein